MCYSVIICFFLGIIGGSNVVGVVEEEQLGDDHDLMSLEVENFHTFGNT